MSDIMHKGKCPFQISKGLLGASSFGTIATINFIQFLPMKKIRKKEQELDRVFQDVQAIKLPWAKTFIGLEGKMTQVRCRIYNEVEKKEKTFGS